MRAAGTASASFQERFLALTAALVLPLALRVLPLPRTIALCHRWPRANHHSASPSALADRTRRWFAHGRGPWANTCLTRSVVLYAMLRQHGYSPRLHIGVAGVADTFVAHAWITVGTQPIAESPGTLAAYRELVTLEA